MTTAADLLANLTDRGLTVLALEDALVIRPPSRLTAADRQAIHRPGAALLAAMEDGPDPFIRAEGDAPNTSGGRPAARARRAVQLPVAVAEAAPSTVWGRELQQARRLIAARLAIAADDDVRRRLLALLNVRVRSEKAFAAWRNRADEITSELRRSGALPGLMKAGSKI